MRAADTELDAGRGRAGLVRSHPHHFADAVDINYGDSLLNPPFINWLEAFEMQTGRVLAPGKRGRKPKEWGFSKLSP